MKHHPSFEKLVGTTIKKYQLTRLIDQSTFGATFLAQYPGTEQRYQVRLFNMSEHLSPEERLVFLGRFQQEASKIAVLQHSAIHPLLEYGNHEGLPYLISLYIPAHCSLAAHLTKLGPLDVVQTGDCLDQIASALEYAHLHAILHCNLTAQIIFVIPTSSSQSLSVVVADFGLTHLRELIQQAAPSLQEVYLDRQICAPEQRSGGPIGPASDIYGLGAILYQMLTSHSIFEGGLDRDDVHQAPLPSLGRWSARLPRQLDEVIQTAMAKRPEKRYQRPADLIDAYHRIVTPGDVDHQLLRVPEPASVQHGPGRQRRNNHLVGSTVAQPSRSVSRRKAIFVIAGVGAAAAAAGVVWANSRSGPDTGSSVPAVAQNATPSSQSAPTQPVTSSTGTHTGVLIAHTSDIPINHAVAFKTPQKGDPGVLIHLANNQFVAFDAVCTHAGCTVAYNPTSKLLECPCHGAKFDPASNAVVTAGPAPTPLTTVKISVNADGTITD